MDRLAKRRRESSLSDEIFHWDVLLEVESKNPNRKPDWRWRLAQELSSDENELIDHCPDEWLLETILQLRIAASPAIAGRYADYDFEPVRSAIELHNTAGEKRDLVQGLLFAKVSITQIASIVQLDHETVEAYRTLFCDHR